MSTEWTAGAIDPDDHGAPPSPDAWEPVTVPGRPPSLAGAEAVAYRCRVADPRESAAQRAVLTVRGVYATAAVWIDGQRVAEGDLGGPIRVPFEPDGPAEVIVACYAPIDRFGGVEDTDAVPATARVPSIRGGVDVTAVPRTYIHDLTVSGDLEGEHPTIDVRATIDASEAVDERLTLSLRPEGFRGGGAMERVRVESETDRRVTVERSMAVRDERRWWPHEQGPQYRYTVRAKLGDHERSATTGLVDVEREADGGLLLNGQRHRPRGVTVPPGAEPETVVEHALAANATLVRARSHVPTRDLVRACDEAGLLFWQDLPLTGPGSVDVERGAALVESLVASRGHHPSLVCWGVHDDPVDPYDASLGSGRLARLRYRWRAWRASHDPAAAEAIGGSLPANVVVYPVTGPPGVDPEAAHVYPGWRSLAATDVDWLAERYPAVGETVGAVGAGSASAGGDGDASGPTATGATEEESATARIPSFDDAAYPTEDPAESQREQARVLRTVLDALRRRATGTVVLDALLDTADAGGTGVVTADGDPKPARDVVARTFQPVQAVLDGPPTGGAVGVTVCNDTGTERTGELAWRAGAREGSVDVTVAAFGRADADAVQVPDGAERLALELRLADETVTNEYDLGRWR